MQTFEIITLVDITRTDNLRPQSDYQKLQQSNLNALIQTIGLRSNIDWIVDPVKHTGTVPVANRGKAAHWIWEFNTEQNGFFLDEDGEAGLLIKDLQGVPIIEGLDDTVDFSPPAFITIGEASNTWVHIKA